MARIYEVRQRQADRRWDMTVSSDDEGWCHAIGYCAGYREIEANATWCTPERARLENERIRPFQAKYHTVGHDTAAEAEACYWDYKLDQHLVFHDDRERADTLHQCVVCGAYTSGYAELRGELGRAWWLCAAHRTREQVQTVGIL